MFFYKIVAQSLPEIDTKLTTKKAPDVLTPSKTTKFVQFSFLHRNIDHVVPTQH